MSHCSACGHDLRATAKFCTACGHRVTVAPTPTQLAEAAEVQSSTVLSVTNAATTEPVPAIVITEAGAALSAPVTEPVVRPSSPPAAVTTPTSVEHPPAGVGTEPAGQVVTPPVPQGAHPRYPEPGTVAAQRYDAAALSAAAGQARAHVGSTIQRIPLPQDQVMRAIRDGALLAAGAWLVCAAFLALVDVFTPGNAAPLMWARGGILIVAMAVRASVSLAGDLSDFAPSGVDRLTGSLDTSGSMTFMPLALTVALLVAVAQISRRSDLASPSLTARDRALRALISGASFGVTATVLTVALRTEIEGTTFGANWMQVLFGGTAFVTLAAFAGLGSTASDGARLPHLWAADVHTGLEFVAACVTAAAALVTLVLLFAIMSRPETLSDLGEATSGSGGVLGVLALLLILVLFVPTMLVALAGVMIGASAVVDTSSSGFLSQVTGAEEGGRSWGILQGGLPGFFLLLLVLFCVGLATVVGVRAALRAPAEGVGRHRIWQPAVIAATGWLVLAWVASFSAQGEGSTDNGLANLIGMGSAGVTMTVGVSALGAAAAAAVWTALAAWIGRRAALRLGRLAPGALVHLGGRRLDATWQILVADAVLRRGKTPPKRLTHVADGLRSGAIPPPTALEL